MHTRRITVEVAAATLLLLSGPAYSQSAPQSGTATLEDVVVTATKREEKLRDVAMSVTAVSGDDLTRRQETQFSDFAAQVPGLSLEQIDAGTTRLILRGANVGSVGATVATVVDDIPFSMSSAQANGAFFGANVDTYDLKRVEVLRGPQGTLYGATAEGGLVKYVTNPPNPHAFEADVILGGATVDGGSTVGIAKGMINLPFWNNTAALRVSAVKEGVPGWVDDPATGQTDVNKGQKYSLRASLLIKPSDEFTARATVFDQDLSVGGSPAAQVVGAAANPSPVLFPPGPPPNQFDLVNGLSNSTQWPELIRVHMTYYALNLEYAFKAATLMSSTSYGEMSNRTNGDLTNTNLAPGLTYGSALGGAFYGMPIVVTEDQYQFLHKFNQEFRLTSNPGTTLFDHPFDWQGGAYFTRETLALVQPIGALNPATLAALSPSLGGANIPADYKEWALFADVTYHFSTAFDVELGGRQASTKQDSQVQTFCCFLYGPTNMIFPTLSSSESSHTWSLAPRWHITPDTMLYVRYATGYRPGGPNLPTPTLPNPPTFQPDSTRNYEIGLRSELFDKQFTIDVALYDIEWKNVQILSLVTTPSGPVGINGNSGSARSKGVEWNFEWRPVTGLTVGLLGAYTDAKLTSGAPGLGALSGQELPYVPDVQATVNVDYSWHAFGSFNAIVGASWSYFGTQYSGFSPSTPVEPHAELPTYNTTKVQVGLDNGRYSVEAYASNLTNARGITEYENNGGANQTGLATFIQPRTIGIQVGARF